MTNRSKNGLMLIASISSIALILGYQTMKSGIDPLVIMTTITLIVAVTASLLILRRDREDQKRGLNYNPNFAQMIFQPKK